MRYKHLIIISISVLGAWLLPLGVFAQAVEVCPSSIQGLDDVQLKHLLEVCEREIAESEAKLTLTQKQATSITNIISELKLKIKKSELEIKARNIAISRLGDQISVQVKHIGSLEERIDLMKESLGELMRKTSTLTQVTPVEIVLSGQTISKFFESADNYATVNNKLNDTLLQIREVKLQAEEEKKGLEGSRLKENELRYLQLEEKKQTESYRKLQEQVLKLTNAQALEYKKLIAEKERVKNEIRNRIFRTVGGQELSFGEALKLVRLHETRIGVSAALTLAVLSQESSVNNLIGKNIGKCFYNQTAANDDGTVMAKSQQDSFLAIMSELSLNPNTTPVSCPIYSDGAYGGAMGPAQFMPNTWWNVNSGFGYKKRIANVTGIVIPSPFNNLDAFTGTALYLSDGLSRCVPAFPGDIFKQRACTAAKYYAGLTISGARLARYMNPVGSYGYQVASRAAKFDQDIATLDQ